MSGHHPFSELTKNFPPERHARVAEKVQLLKQGMALVELRKARQQSQADLAARLQVHQPAIAKLEHRADMYVSNLRRFIEAMGGRLEIVAHFPEGSVTITNFCEVEAEEPTTSQSTPVSCSAAAGAQMPFVLPIRWRYCLVMCRHCGTSRWRVRVVARRRDVWRQRVTPLAGSR